MKLIMLSTQPKWVEKIFVGTKDDELRKTKPKELPAKVYIYQTKQKWFFPILHWLKLCQGKVVAEFDLKKITEHKFNDGIYDFSFREMENTGFINSYEFDEFLKSYGNGKTLYAWKIENLIIYYKPKELSEFNLKKAPQSWCFVEEIKE